MPHVFGTTPRIKKSGSAILEALSPLFANCFKRSCGGAAIFENVWLSWQGTGEFFWEEALSGMPTFRSACKFSGRLEEGTGEFF